MWHGAELAGADPPTFFRSSNLIVTMKCVWLLLVASILQIYGLSEGSSGSGSDSGSDGGGSTLTTIAPIMSPTMASMTEQALPTSMDSTTEPTTMASMTEQGVPTTMASTTELTTMASMTEQGVPTTMASTTEPTTMASMTEQGVPTTMASTTEPTTMASMTEQGVPTTMASTTEPTTMASMTEQGVPTTMASTTEERVPTTMAITTEQRVPTTRASTTEPTTMASTAEPTTMASMTEQGVPTTMAITTEQRVPTTMATTTEQSVPTTMASTTSTFVPTMGEVVIGWEEESYEISEALLQAQLCAVVMSGEVSQTLIVVLFYEDGGNATGRVDFPPEPDSQLIFTPNISIACVSIAVFDDDEVEGTEVFLVSLSTNSSNVTLQPNTTIVIIVDDDPEAVTTTITEETTSVPQLPTPQVLLVPPERRVNFGDPVDLICSASSTSNGDMSVIFELVWNITFSEEEEPITLIVPASSITYHTNNSVSTTLTHVFLNTTNFTVTCTGIIAAEDDSLLRSDPGVGQILLSVSAPLVMLTITPNDSPLIIADIPPYNNYTLRCDAFLPQGPMLRIYFTWLDSITGEELMPNDSISIQNSIRETLINNELVMVYRSEVAISEMINSMSTFHRDCIVNLLYQEIRNGVVQGGTLTRVASASQVVTIRGPSPPATVEQFSVFGLSFDLAIIEWIVPRIAYVPETYHVIYQEVLNGVPQNPAYISERVNGTTNITSVDDGYVVVLRNLEPDTDYMYSITSINPVTRTNSSQGVFITRSNDEELYNFSDDIPSVYPIGASVDIELTVEISQPLQSIQVFSLSQNQLIPPTSIQTQENLIRILYNQATPSLNGEIVVCLLTNPLPDHRRKRTATDPSQCGSIINIDVITPTLNISTHLLIVQYMGNQLLTDENPSVTCLPSDPAAPVRWRGSALEYPNTPSDLPITFASDLNHTAIFETVYFPMPPLNLYILVCDLVDAELQNGEETSPQSVVVRFIQNPVSVITNDEEVLPNAVINTASSLTRLSLICLSTMGNRDLYWEANNIPNLNDGEITIEETTNFAPFDVNYVLDTDLLFLDRSFITLSSDPTYQGVIVTGSLSCKSRESNVSSSDVYLTTTNPLWEVLSPVMDTVPMGAQVSLTLQYGDNSNGYQNQGLGFMYTLIFIPCVATQPDVTLLVGNSREFSNILEFSFRARLNDDSGEYVWNATHINTQSQFDSSSNIVVVRPFLLEYDYTVYTLPDAVISLRCLPNDTRAPILWRRSLSGSDDLSIYPQIYTLTPPDFGHTISFNASQVLVQQEADRESRQSESSPERVAFFLCGFVNGNDRSQLSDSITTMVISQQEEVKVIHQYENRIILNNTVINSFIRNLESKRAASTDYTYESPELPDRNTGFIEAYCSGVQGSHEVIWITDNQDIGNSDGVVNCDPRPNSQEVLSNYSSSLSLRNIGPIIVGNYTCMSSISNMFVTFQVTLENPYIRRLTSEVVIVESGDPVTLIFLAAVNSDGNEWTMPFFTFTKPGVRVPATFENVDPNFPQHYSLSILSVEDSHQGIYTASALDQECSIEFGDECPSFTEVSITLEVISYCEDEVVDGFLWPRTVENSAHEVSCNLASEFFRSETLAVRQCQDGGIWGASDLTTCTLQENVEPFLLLWFVIETEDDSLESGSFSVDGTPDEQTKLFLETEMYFVLEDHGVQVSSISLQASYVASISLVFEVILSAPPDQQSSALNDFIDYLNNVTIFGGYQVQDGNRGSTGVTAASSCPCTTFEEVEGSAASVSFLSLCAGSPSSPCNCIGDSCQCAVPFVGDGVLCTVDTDGDSYPDMMLESPSCDSDSIMQATYCIQDNCPMVYNLEQDPNACQPDTGFTGCPFGPDPTWFITWANTPHSTTDTQGCPGGLEATGRSTRYCNDMGEWSEPDVSLCQSVEFTAILAEAMELLSSQDPAEQLEASVVVTSQLSDSTNDRTAPLLPSDIQTANIIIDQVINILEENTGAMAGSGEDENIVNIFNSLLDTNNTIGWNNLRNRSTTDGSELLLNSAERFGLVLARSQETAGQLQRFSRPNIVFSAVQYNDSSQVDTADLIFPAAEDMVNFTADVNPLKADIPFQVIEERIQKLDANSNLPVVHILFKNLNEFLPSSLLGSEDLPDGSSVVYSTQIGDKNSTKQQSDALEENPLSLKFTFDEIMNVSKYTCSFWQFSEPIGSGSFSADGVLTNSNNTEDSLTSVHCLSNHTTSFAVLVDVGGGLQDNRTTVEELKALQIVSYIGSAISILCLSFTVIFFLTQRKKLLESLSSFVHLNLAITLLAAFVVFVLGIELGNSTTGGCLFVALLLHYLFLSAFCWMLCEGVVLYLLLVVVFSRVTRQWWLFILIGYVAPIPIVVISVAIRHDYYGVKDSGGNLLYCWLSVEKGTIFAFVAPMLVIIIINVVFLILGLNSLWKSKVKRYSRSKKEANDKNYAAAKSLFLASIILLPLLGLTWIFGLLTINANSTVFAWLFTIFNSLQGAAIFFFHVVRNDKVWARISPGLSVLRKRKSTIKRTSHSTSTMSHGGTMKKSGHTASYSMSSLNKSGALKVSDDLSTTAIIAEETKADLEVENGKISSNQEEDNEIIVNLQTSTLEKTQETPDTQNIFSVDGEVIMNPLATTSIEKPEDSKVGSNSPSLNTVKGDADVKEESTSSQEDYNITKL